MKDNFKLTLLMIFALILILLSIFIYKSNSNVEGLRGARRRSARRQSRRSKRSARRQSRKSKRSARRAARKLRRQSRRSKRSARRFARKLAKAARKSARRSARRSARAARKSARELKSLATTTEEKKAAKEKGKELIRAARQEGRAARREARKSTRSSKRLVRILENMIKKRKKIYNKKIKLFKRYKRNEQGSKEGFKNDAFNLDTELEYPKYPTATPMSSTVTVDNFLNGYQVNTHYSGKGKINIVKKPCSDGSTNLYKSICITKDRPLLFHNWFILRQSNADDYFLHIYKGVDVTETDVRVAKEMQIPAFDDKRFCEIRKEFTKINNIFNVIDKNTKKIRGDMTVEDYIENMGAGDDKQKLFRDAEIETEKIEKERKVIIQKIFSWIKKNGRHPQPMLNKNGDPSLDAIARDWGKLEDEEKYYEMMSILGGVSSEIDEIKEMAHKMGEKTYKEIDKEYQAEGIYYNDIFHNYCDLDDYKYYYILKPFYIRDLVDIKHREEPGYLLRDKWVDHNNVNKWGSFQGEKINLIPRWDKSSGSHQSSGEDGVIYMVPTLVSQKNPVISTQDKEDRDPTNFATVQREENNLKPSFVFDTDQGDFVVELNVEGCIRGKVLTSTEAENMTGMGILSNFTKYLKCSNLVRKSGGDKKYKLVLLRNYKFQMNMMDGQNYKSGVDHVSYWKNNVFLMIPENKDDQPIVILGFHGDSAQSTDIDLKKRITASIQNLWKERDDKPIELSDEEYDNPERCNYSSVNSWIHYLISELRELKTYNDSLNNDILFIRFDSDDSAKMLTNYSVKLNEMRKLSCAM